jgi:hypothetical protein
MVGELRLAGKDPPSKGGQDRVADVLKATNYKQVPWTTATLANSYQFVLAARYIMEPRPLRLGRGNVG